jgi:glutaredoxin-like protein NrdH
MPLTLYIKPSCVQCDATKAALTRHGLDYVSVDLTTNAEAMSRVQSLGFRSAPVVELEDGTSWSGFRPDLIEVLGKG